MQLTVADAAFLLGATEGDVRGWIRDKGLPAHHIGDVLRLNRSEVLEWAMAHGIPLASEDAGGPGAGGPLPSLAEALREGGVHRGIGGRDKREVLRSAVAALRLPADFDRDVLLAVLLARETQGSTGIGDGVAIPHVRTPIVVHLALPAVTLFLLDAPVDFDAIDGRPVHAMFLLTVPTVRAHQHLLSRLSIALRRPELRSMLDAREDAGRILDAVDRIERSLPAPWARGGP